MSEKQKMKFDIIFLSYDEPYAEEHWQRLKKRFPYAQRVHGVKGILNAHKKCDSIARTDKYYIVDGDEHILKEFNFNNVRLELQEGFYYIWSSRNAVNDLKYPNGGVKLFPKGIFDGVEEYGVDLFEKMPHKLIDEVASLNRFNSSPFCSWRAGFRECVQLACQHSKQTTKQIRIYLLNIWCNKGADRKFGKWCIRGARAGRRYGMENLGNIEAVELMNDFDWLQKRFYHELKKYK